MSYFLFIVRSALEDFNRNKVRTALTSLGILIGVSSVVLLIALGLGLKAYIKQQFESMGTNTLFVMPGSVTSAAGLTGTMISEVRFSLNDVQALRRIRNVISSVPFFSAFASMQGDVDSGTYEIAATTSEVFSVMNIEVQNGQLFTKSDVDKGAKKVVLGPTVAKKLYGSVDAAVGKTVKIQDQAFKVAGVFKSKGGGGLGGSSLDDHVFMPYTAAYSFNPNKTFFMIYLKVNNQTDIPQVKADAQSVINKRYKGKDISVVEQTEILNTVNSIFSILNSVLIAIAAISLIVGGVGIMNIMYVSVVERIHEIGIRRSAGALKKDILYQFLAESVLLSALGGVLGLIISALIVLILRTVFPAYIDLMTVIIAISVSSLVGIVFGVFPAKKAADLSPIDAIRYE